MHDQLFESLRRETSPLRADQTFRRIEDTLTPLELSRSLAMFDRLTGVAADVVAKSDILKVLREAAPQRYERRILSEDVAMYAAPGGLKAAKSLIVAFCGRSHRLMTPWSLFLQSIPASAFDVLILADRSNNHFFNGIEGYAQSLYALSTRVLRDAKARDYSRLLAFGTSTGGLPALRFGLLAGADRAISVGGQMAWHIQRLRMYGGEHALQAFDPLCACSKPRKGQLVCVFAEHSAPDVLSARHMQAVVGAVPVSLAGTDKHNVIYEIYKTGKLPQFYERLFGQRNPGRTNAQTAGD